MALTTVRSTGISSLPSISGANLTTLNASNISSGTLNSARFSGGKIGQVVYGEYNQQVQSSAGGFIDSGLTASITPSATSSKILVLVTQQTGKGNSPTAGYYFNLRLQRQIASGGYSDVKYVTSLGNYEAGTSGGDKHIAAHEYSLHHLDTTNTTSQVDYKTITNAETGLITNIDDSGSAHRGEASMVLMEILA
tara:strand:- start:28 stop:609 length:582 start_codon:yes stop_codon:yes gene_type:complete